MSGQTSWDFLHDTVEAKTPSHLQLQPTVLTCALEHESPSLLPLVCLSSSPCLSWAIITQSFPPQSLRRTAWVSPFNKGRPASQTLDWSQGAQLERSLSHLTCTDGNGLRLRFFLEEGDPFKASGPEDSGLFKLSEKNISNSGVRN